MPDRPSGLVQRLVHEFGGECLLEAAPSCRRGRRGS
jgi:hypothetical protein